MIKDERGIAMVIVMFTLALLLIVTGTVAATSVHLKTTSTTDRASTRALEVAEAGVQVARYRLNRSNPTTPTACPWSPAAATPALDGSGNCPAVTGSLGNGATYSYIISQGYSAAPPCGGSAPGSGRTARCITATGTVNTGGNAANRRIQVRVDATVDLGQGLVFPGGEIVSLGDFQIDGGADIYGAPAAADGTITGANPGSVALGCKPGATAPTPSGCTPVSRQSTTWASQIPTVQQLDASGVDGGYSWTSTLTPKGPANLLGNLNSDVATTCANNGGLCTYNATTRALKVNNGSLTLCTPGATCAYNFCQITIAGGGGNLIRIAPDANDGTMTKVLIFLDVSHGSAADRPDAAHGGCSGNSGPSPSLDLQGSSSLGNSGQARQLSFYDYGYDNGCNRLFNLAGGSNFSAFIFAPRDDVELQGSGAFVGGIVACYLHIHGGKQVTADTSVDDVKTNNSSRVGVFTRPTPGGWRECNSRLSGTAC